MTKQPEALRLADLLEDWAKDYATTDFDCDMGDQAAAELRRLYQVNQELLEALKELVYWYQVRNDKNGNPLPAHNQNPEIKQAIEAIAKATGEQQ